MTIRHTPAVGASASVEPAGMQAAVASAANSHHRQGASVLLRVLFAIPIVLLPNALYVPMDTGIPGMNVSNLLFLALLAALTLSPRETAPALTRTGYLTPPLLAFFLALVVGFIIAQWDDTSNASADLTNLKNAIFYPLFYFVYRRCRQDLRGTRQLILLVLLVAAVAGLTAIYQGLQFGLGSYDGTMRASGPFGGITKANRAGVFYAMFLPMFAAVAVLSSRKSLRVAALIGCMLLAVAILFTYSRQSYLIALVGLLILLMHRSLLAAVLAGLLLVVSVNLFPDSVVERVQETRRLGPGGTSAIDNSTASRLEIWEGAIDMWRDQPEGVGLGRFPLSIGEYSSYRNRDAHNIFILILAECGPLGLAALLWVFWRLWALARRLRRIATADDPEPYALAVGFGLTVISLALGNVYGSPFFDGLIMANFWILCGLMERYGALKAQPSGQSQPHVPSDSIGDRFPLFARAMPGAIGSNLRRQ